MIFLQSENRLACRCAPGRAKLTDWFSAEDIHLAGRSPIWRTALHYGLDNLMTNEQIASIKRDYDRDGFVILRGYIQGRALEELRERATRLAADLFERQRNGEDLHLHRRKPGPVRWKGNLAPGDVFKGLQRHDAWFDRELQAGNHVPLIEALVEDELEPATAAWFTKSPGSKGELAPHRDAIGRPQGRQTGATIWIALDSADPANGCLHYGCGSQRIKCAADAAFDTDAETAVAAVVEPGDAIIHDAWTVHWSRGNPTDRPRRAVSFFYWGASNRTGEAGGGAPARRVAAHSQSLGFATVRTKEGKPCPE